MDRWIAWILSLSRTNKKSQCTTTLIVIKPNQWVCNPFLKEILIFHHQLIHKCYSTRMHYFANKTSPPKYVSFKMHKWLEMRFSLTCIHLSNVINANCFTFSASCCQRGAVKCMNLKVSVKNISHDVCLIPAQVFSQGFSGSVLCKSRSLTFYIPHALSSHSSTGTDNTWQIS